MYHVLNIDVANLIIINTILILLLIYIYIIAKKLKFFGI